MKKMKKICLLIGLTFIASISFSQDQEMKTLFNKDTSNKAVDTYGGYGAPFVGATQIDGDLSIIVGGKGAVVKNHTFAFGGVGTAIISTKSKTFNKYVDSTGKSINNYNPFSDSSVIGNRTISLGYGGIFVEYIFNYTSPVHVSIPLNIQVGGVLAGTDSDDLKIKSSSVFVIEPGINFEFNFYKFFIPTLNIGYRYVSGDYSSSLSGVYGSLIFKFGKY